MMPSSASLCAASVEDVFGPAVARSCLGGFDFTLLFEETILTILPLAIAVLLTFVRLNQLRTRTIKVRYSHLVPVKLLIYLTYVALQIALLALWSPAHVAKTRATIASIAFSLAAFVLFISLSYLEYKRSLRPSTLLNLYLGISTLLDLARVRTLFYFAAGHTIASLFLASFCVKFLILVLELVEKRPFLLDEWKSCGPEDTASSYKRVFFLWLNRLFAKSYRNKLTLETLPKIDADLLAASEPDVLRQKWVNAEKSGQYALLWTFMKHYKWTILSASIARLCYTGFSFAQPFMIDRVLTYTATPADQRSENEAYGLIGAYAIVYIGAAIALPLYEQKVYRTLTKFRGSLMTLIYEKTLTLGSSSGWNAEAITLMSADIDRLGICVQDLHELYAGTLEVALCLWLLYVYLGVAVAAVAGWSVLCIVSSGPVAVFAGKAQVPWLEAIEVRLTATAHALGNFKLIRMTGLTDGVAATLRALRLDEIRAARRYRILNMFLSIGYYLSYAFSPVWGYGVYIFVAKANGTYTLTSGTAFGALALFQLLNKPTVMLVDGIEHAQTVVECFTRFQEYLMREEQEAYRTLSSERGGSESDSEISEKKDGAKDSSTAAILRNVSLRYSSEQKPVLHDISLEIPSAQTTVIIGPVGCGKSSLLRLLLGEAPRPENQISTNFTHAAFSAQQPWVSKTTIRENIVGMSEWDETWYRQVLQACSLMSDIAEFPKGDQTEAGTRGSSLSGGQKIRVSLARALYSREPVIILDDVLTGLDSVTEQNVSTAVFGPAGLAKRFKSTVIMASSSAHHANFADHVIVLTHDGRVAQSLPAQEFLAAGGKLPAEDEDEVLERAKSRQEPAEMDLEELGIPDLEEEAIQSRQLGDWKAYSFYAKIAGYKTACTYLIFCAIFMFGLNFPSVWLQYWVDANEREPNTRVNYYLGVFAAFACIAIVANVIGDYMLQLVIVPKTSARFHEHLLTTTAKAQTTHFTATHSGAMLNRFSQDLELIDSDLPGALDKTIFSILQTIFTTVLIFVGSGYLSIALPACILAIYAIQHYYLRTSRQLRHVDIEAREPLFSHFLDTVTAIDSIRAYGWMEEYKRRNREALNGSQAPFYLMWTVQRWLTLVLNLFVAGLAILLVALATNIKHGSTGFLGVALSNIVSFGTTLQLLVTDWTQLETAICAVTRIKTYITETAPEDSDKDQPPAPANWPANGSIVLEGVTATYPSAPKPVLQDINLNIKSGEKVAICGRTGSGKSTLMSTLLRMVELDSGSITIGGMDLVKVPRETIRRALTTVPQDAFFVTGTIRENLDPLQVSNDESLIRMLSDLGLRDMLDTAGGLDSELSDDMLSSGQQQLFCLARAIIRGGPVLLLDEATSSVDAATSDLMQQTLHKTFGNKTVIAIAHRLETIIDFDRVIVLEKGVILESGNPRELLATPGSAFRLLSESMKGLGESS